MAFSVSFLLRASPAPLSPLSTSIEVRSRLCRTPIVRCRPRSVISLSSSRCVIALTRFTDIIKIGPRSNSRRLLGKSHAGLRLWLVSYWTESPTDDRAHKMLLPSWLETQHIAPHLLHTSSEFYFPTSLSPTYTFIIKHVHFRTFRYCEALCQTCPASSSL